MAASPPSTPPADPPAITEEKDTLSGQIVGGYVLGRRLGEGGMGVVYAAEHPRSGHRAAVKILHSEIARRPGILRRLRTEAQATNRVPSPGVVRVLDCEQREDGTAFLAMELCEGDSLRARLDADPDGDGLPLAEALSILTRIAGIMAAAHACGVIHRDLKPANLFLVPAPSAPHGSEVKILDFGLAKIRAEDEPRPDAASQSATQDGALLGTAKYMAPEQAMDPRSADGQVDVYALGAVAHEVLCGRAPFQAATAWELVAMHLRDLPPPLRWPTTRDTDPELITEIERLLKEMLAKSPLLRPDMARVGERFGALLNRAARSAAPSSLAPDPVATRDPKTATLRRPLPLAIALLGVIAVLLGLLGLGLRKQHQVEAQKEAALEIAQQIVRLIDHRLEPVPGAAVASREMLDATVTLLVQQQAQAPRDAAVLHALMRTRTIRGRHLRNHGGLADAHADFKASVELGEALARQHPRVPAYRASLGYAYDGLGDCEEQLTDLASARASFLRAQALRRELLSSDPRDPAVHRDLATSYLHLADLADSLGQSGEVRTQLEAARAELEPLWKADPDSTSYRFLLVGVYYRLAQLLPTLGRTAEGIAMAQQARELQARPLSQEPKHASHKQLMARVQQALGEAQQRSGDLDGAEQAFTEALRLHQSLVQLDPSDPQYRRDLLSSQHKLGDLQLLQGQVDAAERLYQEALKLAEALTQGDPGHRGYRWRLARAHQRMGDVAMLKKQHTEARAAYQRALEIQEALTLADPGNAQDRRRLAILLEKAGSQLLASADLPAAQARLEQALRINQELVGSDPARADYRQAVAAVQQSLAEVARLGEHLREAETALGSARAALEALAAADRDDALVRRELLASLLGLLALAGPGDGARAAALREQAASLLRELDRRHALGSDALLAKLRAALPPVGPAPL